MQKQNKCKLVLCAVGGSQSQAFAAGLAEALAEDPGSVAQGPKHHMDVNNADRLAQHNLHIPEQVSNCTIYGTVRGKGDTLAQKSRVSPPPQSYKEKKANVDLEGYWKHPAPEPGLHVPLVYMKLVGHGVSEWKKEKKELAEFGFLGSNQYSIRTAG
eukprot:1155345-Pelagomonas_calceolata.AAC.1